VKILIIEDEAHLAESIQSYLKSNDLIIELSSTVKDAMDKVTIYEYDCIL